MCILGKSKLLLQYTAVYHAEGLQLFEIKNTIGDGGSTAL